MDTRFSVHNTHLENPSEFPRIDPHLRQLSRLPLVHRSDLIAILPIHVPGIYTVSGGRQVGKTTLLKQWMAGLICNRVDPRRIFYITGELVDDHHSLVRLATDTLNEMADTAINYLIIDEVTYIKHWDKGIKYLADAGMLENVMLVLTGSDMLILKESRIRFPGRRGVHDEVDFHLYPLSFYEYVQLKATFTENELGVLTQPKADPHPDLIIRLYNEFGNYLIHGGYLTAINDMARHGKILPATFSTYSDWIRGDILKRNKREHYLKEILSALIKRYGSQITWNTLAQDLSIDHPMTVTDYVNLLASMDAVFIQPAIREDTLCAAPKKAKKIMFTDPFIYHAIRAWLFPVKDPFVHQIQPLLTEKSEASKIVEACVATLYRRYYPTFYIKAEGEVDIAYVNSNRFWPVEIKWTRQLHPKQLKQIAKYPHGRILTGLKVRGEINNIPTEPLPLAMLKLGIRDG